MEHIPFVYMKIQHRLQYVYTIIKISYSKWNLYDVKDKSRNSIVFVRK